MKQELKKVRASSARASNALDHVRAASIRVTVIGATGLAGLLRFSKKPVFCICEVPGKWETRFQTNMADVQELGAADN